MSDFWRGKRVLVTGGAGFLGSWVAQQLVENDAVVRITTRSADAPGIAAFRDKLDIAVGDLEDEAFAQKAAEDQEIVIHLATLKRNIEYHRAHPADLLRVNTRIAINILEASRTHGIKQFLLVSTNLIDKRVLEDETAPHYGYAWSKYFSEVLAKAYRVEYDLPILIARPNNVYGPRDNFAPGEAQVVPSIIARAATHQKPLEVFGDGTAARPFAYVEDVAAALLKLLETPQTTELFDITGDELTRISELAGTVLRLTNQPGNPIHYSVEPPAIIPPLPPAPPADGTAIKLSRRLEEGLSRTIEWYTSDLNGKG